jgi:hypothetical protein
MKKLLLALLLIAISTSAMAEWIYISESANGDKTYMDISTIKKTGSGTYKVWDLLDYAQPQILGASNYLSLATNLEFDCNNDANRHIYFVGYSENMGKGNVIGSENGSQTWKPEVPGSVGFQELKFICSFVKKKK